MRSVLCSVLVAMVLLSPMVSSAALVPCDGADCQACHLVQLGQNIIEWLITVMTFVIALVFVAGGFQMVTSGGDSGAVSSAREKMTNAIIGLMIMLLAWLIVDTALKMLLKPEERNGMGPWSEVSCVAQPQFAWTPYPDRSRGVSADSPTPATLPAATTRVAGRAGELCSIAQSVGVPASECSSLKAIMTQESGGNPNAISPAGAIGLMQVMPSAARSLDPSLVGMTDAQVREKLLDPTYNMKIGSLYYKKAIDQFGVSNYDSIYASYNGGFGATKPSANCDGMQRWQCGWDDDAHTIENTGYAETRDYVRKVNSYRTQYNQPGT